LGGNISRGYGRVEFLVQVFQGYDINGNPKGGFKGDDGKSVNYCQSQRNDIEFLKGK
jgi:hypothetical protein